MSKPEFTHNAGIFKLLWSDIGVSVRVDRLSEDSKFTVTGEILIRMNAPGLSPHIHQARLNLTSTTARKGLVSLLKERVPDVDWYAVVEQTCVMVLERHREGEPAIHVAEYQPKESLGYRINPLFFEGKNNLIYGPPGVLKSYLATYFVALVNHGLNHNMLAAEPGNVLYLDWEGDIDEFHKRLRLVHAGLGLTDMGGVYYRFCYQPLAAEITEIQRMCVEKNIEFVVSDSASPACGNEPEDAAAVGRYFTALRSLRATTLTIAHQTKNGDPMRGPFGSFQWLASPRTLFHVRRSADAPKGEALVGMVNVKVNNADLLPPLGFRIVFTPDAVEFSRADVRDIPEADQARSLRERIREALLSSGKMTATQLSEELGAPAAEVRARLNQYKGRDFTQVPGWTGREPLWGVLTKE